MKLDSEGVRRPVDPLPRLRGDACRGSAGRGGGGHNANHNSGARTPPWPAPTKTGDWLRKVLLDCGPLSALAYIGWHELAALQWDGYSRIFNAINELSLTGAPSKWMLDPWEGLVDNALLVAFGIGIWRSAQGSRALRVIGGLQILSGAIFPLWLLFGEASLTAHLVLFVAGISTWLGSMGFGAAALGRRFRIYSLLSLAMVVTFNALALAYAPEVAAGQPTPWIGLYERIAFSAYFLWLSVLAVALWRRRAIKDMTDISSIVRRRRRRSERGRRPLLGRWRALPRNIGSDPAALADGLQVTLIDQKRFELLGFLGHPGDLDVVRDPPRCSPPLRRRGHHTCDVTFASGRRPRGEQSIGQREAWARDG